MRVYRFVTVEVELKQSDDISGEVEGWRNSLMIMTLNIEEQD